MPANTAALPKLFSTFPLKSRTSCPKALGGETTKENLALSCRSCNLYKSDYVSAMDELTEQEVVLFNPRLDVWREHFAFTEETGEIRGLTATGRATISRLRINSSAQLEARKQWLQPGLIHRS
jgi:HNH endonuclease